MMNATIDMRLIINDKNVEVKIGKMEAANIDMELFQTIQNRCGKALIRNIKADIEKFYPSAETPAQTEESPEDEDEGDADESK